jgi:hypothetical protein
MKYRVHAQGYGGGGASVNPYESSDKNKVKRHIEDLLETDHAVQLYEIDDNGNKNKIEFEHYSSITVIF